MILLVFFSPEKMHFFEFVKPVQDIVKACGKKCSAKHYSEITAKDVEKAEKIILCGTSLRDTAYLNNLEKFSFLKKFRKPVLGICAGMQVIAEVFSCGLEKCAEIGLVKIEFEKNFLGAEGIQEVFELHNFGVKDSAKLREIFDVYAETGTVQAFMHRWKPFYGVLFHPEVRQKELVKNFVDAPQQANRLNG